MIPFGSGLRSVTAGAGALVEGAVNETVLRVAVTGLSRAGKTVFLTSLIHNLLAFGAGRNTLPALQARLGGNGGGTRLHAVRIEPAGAATLPSFDYATKLSELAAETPAWPPRTDDLARIALDLEVDRQGLLTRLGPRRIRLELLDYPGEWLLDLPLLGLSFAAWSRQTLELLARPPRAEACAAFRSFLRGLDPGAPADDAAIRQGHALYRAGLQDCRTRFGLRYLQPGRFLCPGPRTEAPFLWFFPLPEVPEHPARGSVAALLRDRFEAYKADMRAQFFDTHFAAFDRQVVLVDVLGALHAGRAAFEDTERAIADIAAHLRYKTDQPSSTMHTVGSAAARIGAGIGRNFPSGAALGAGMAALGVTAMGIGAAAALSRPRIERVAFVATKADHVPSQRRENLRNLVRDIAEAARPQNGFGQHPISYHAVASVLSTTDAMASIDGRPVEVVRGVKLGEARARSFYPGDVPSGRPPEGFWRERCFELPVFAPPRLDPGGGAGIPHLGLDAVLDSLIGDKL